MTIKPFNFFRYSIVFVSILLVGCMSTQPDSKKQAGKIKNLIVMIGDGMGPQQIGLLDSYVRYTANPVIDRSAFERSCRCGG